jgi:PIN domain
MLVVLDANVFCADFQMKGNAFRIFLAGFRRAGLRPCVPESVSDEVLNKYRENCDELAIQAQKLKHRAARLVGRDVLPVLADKEYMNNLYSIYLCDFLTLQSDNDFERLPYPTISHRDLAKRALRARRPFRDNEIGYRDSLLWVCLLEHLKQTKEPIVFVSNNTRDFGQGGELHEHLREDLTEIGLSEAHVKLFHSLEELNHALILPTLEKLDNIRLQIEEESGPFLLKDWVSKELHDLFWDEVALGPLEPDHGSCRFSHIDKVNSVTIDAVRQLNRAQILVSATANVDAILNVTADWDDYLQYPDVREFFPIGQGDGPFEFADADLPVTLTAAFTIILQDDKLEVLSKDLDWYESDFSGTVDINPHAQDEEPA